MKLSQLKKKSKNKRVSNRLMDVKISKDALIVKIMLLEPKIALNVYHTYFWEEIIASLN